MHPTRDITSAGKKIKLVSRRATYFEAQLLFDQQTAFLRPEAAKLMTLRASPSQFSWAHPFTGYSPTVWKSPPDYCNKDRQHHSTHSSSSTGHQWKQEKAEYQLALNHQAGTHKRTHHWGAPSGTSTAGRTVSPSSFYPVAGWWHTPVRMFLSG